MAKLERVVPVPAPPTPVIPTTTVESVTVSFTGEEAATLLAITGRIGGFPAGYRGVVDSIREGLINMQGIKDLSEHIGSRVDGGGMRFLNSKA